MNIRDYNKIIEFIEGNFLGRTLRVSARAGDSPDNLQYRGKLEKAVYKTERGEVNRLPENYEDTPDLEMNFNNFEIKLRGYGLALGSIMDWSLPNPENSGRYLLCNELDNPLMVELEEIK